MSHLSNLLSNIQTGVTVRHKMVNVKRTKLNLEVLKLLYSEGFIDGYSLSHNKINHLSVHLKYFDGKPVLKKLRIISVPSRRIFVNFNTVEKSLSKAGLFVISTSKFGLVFSDSYFKDSEKFVNVGGELLFQVIF